MSKGVNRITLLGNVGQDPKGNTLPSGQAVCNLSLATTESYMNKQTNQKVDETTWHDITFYGKLAEITNQYVQKGSQIYVEGKVKTQTWTDKDTGKEMRKNVVIAREMQLLGRRDGNTTGNSAPPTSQDPAPSGTPDFDSEIPF